MNLVVLIAFLFQSTSAKCEDALLTNILPDDIRKMQHFKVNEWENFDTEEVVTSMLMGDGNTYDEFLVVHPPAWAQQQATNGYVEWQHLNANYDSFTGLIGLAANSHCSDKYATQSQYDGFECKIYVDNILKYSSKRIASISDFEHINIDTRNGNILKIEVHSGQTAHCDHAILANPLLNHKSTIVLPLPVYESGTCASGNWFRIGYLSDLNQIWDFDNEDLYRYEFGIDYNGGIGEVVVNTWGSGLRVSTVNNYPMGDNANQLRLGRTIYTYDLDGNPTRNNWYHYYYFTDTDSVYFANGNHDCLNLYMRRINQWQQVGVLSDIVSTNEPILGYSILEYEYAIEYNHMIHKVIINGWNQGFRVSTINSYPMGDDSNSLRFGKTIFTKGLIGNENQNDWYQKYLLVNGDNHWFSVGVVQNSVSVFAKPRESMCV
eukprot:249889_1